MSAALAYVLRAVLVALVGALAKIIIEYFDQYVGSPPAPDWYE